jgi:hypothetical protein
VKGARERLAVIITSRKSNKNRPVLQQMLKNVALIDECNQCTWVGVVYCLEFFSGNC